MPELASRTIDYTTSAQVFSGIYDNKVWGNGSGASSPDQSRPYMNLLTGFMANNDIRSVVDVGCGDWQFSREIDWSGVTYHGFDVVDSVIRENRTRFGRENISFSTLGGIGDLPPADLVVCKDVLQHLPTAAVAQYLDVFLGRYKFAIVTNDARATMKSGDGDVECGPDYLNVDIDYGNWRMIRPDLAPFNLKVAVLLRWTIVAPTMSWTKDACLLIGRQAAAVQPSGKAGWRRLLDGLKAG